MSGVLPWMRTAAFSPRRWQRAQSSGTLRAKVGDSGSFLDLVAWAEWQSLQPGASGSLAAARVPCALMLYCSTCWAWQTPQSAFRVIVSQGRVCDGATSVWHWAQAVLACLEAA